MRKVIYSLVACTFFVSTILYAQDNAQTPASEPKTEANSTTTSSSASTPVQEETFHQALKTKFIEGGWEFMSLVLICLILGLSVAIERIITLNLATTNTTKLVKKVEEALEEGGVEAALQVTKSTRGPVASIFTQGLMRMSEGIEMVEKSIIAYGSVEMAKLERGLVWISLFIALAPMLGFLGTVIGMIQAFDMIEAAGDISPTVVAGGIKVALITTVGGLVVAIILQLCYNYCSSKIDGIVGSMEEASISLVDVLIKHNLTKK
ncbi:MAG: MotA/TolQ/ExbB proton channel family protein [Cytophagales bacterium]|nr:MotA/TolQ/ExbB proton channel family protein [Cytophagales bacterium]MDW8383309.1 MotA/TolQ/ExbB proton channel family protein [Flammeovirgaceae bacterium]